MIRLKPFDTEPMRKLKENVLEELDSYDSLNSVEGEELENKRIGNDEWCAWGKNAKQMETYIKGLCCQETNKIQETYFQGRSIYIYIYLIAL